MFNYITATVEELVQHIKLVPSSQISTMKSYHTKKGNLEVVDKINACRLIAKQDKMRTKLAMLLETQEKVCNTHQMLM